MSKILSSPELWMHLNNFYEIIQTFNNDELDNVVFFNLESIYTYMDNDLQDTLDHLQPYLPFLSSERAKSFLKEIIMLNNDESIEQLKDKYTNKLRLDFINASLNLTNETDWYHIAETCQQIRDRKEETHLH